jgi:hypothetical protein
MAHLAWSIAVKRLAICINSFTEVYIGLAIIELAPVKDADFDHFYHLLSAIDYGHADGTDPNTTLPDARPMPYGVIGTQRVQVPCLGHKLMGKRYLVVDIPPTFNIIAS